MEYSAPRSTPSTLLVWRTGVFVFVASCATLVLELIAGRMLSPYLGVSLATWTTIIGVVLAGISLGNWMGGKVADRYPSQRTAGILFLLGAASTVATLGIIALLGDGGALRPYPLLLRTFLLTTAVFFLPSLVLSMITPVAIRLILPDVRNTGRIVGLVYALGTVGSLFGNFLTGFVLVAYLPVTTIVIAVGAVLLSLGILGGEWRRSPYPHPSRGFTAEAQSDGLSEDATSVSSDSGGEEGHRNSSAVPGSSSGKGDRPSRLLLRGNVTLACIVVVISSFCTMAIELAASRALAPYVGVSLYSWTGIIGVVLGGVAIGNYAGGRIADRWPRQHVLGLSLFLGGLASLSTLLAVELVAQPGLFNAYGLMERIVALTAAIFFIPVLILGTISPQVIKLVVADLAHAGRTSGRVYAWSTAGAIVGTFATGWLLISVLGVNRLILAAGLALIALAITVGRFWRNLPALATAVVILAASVYVLIDRKATDSPCTAETNYFCIKVHEEVRNGDTVKTLVLDHLVHSYVKIGDPSFLGYEHEQVQAELARYAAAKVQSPRVLVVGGGGYTFPRWVEAYVPTASVEVVEIDPGVTETAYQHLGLPRSTKIVSHNLDGRQFIHEMAPKRSYQLVVQDAVNDLSVPYHILTKEYNDYIRDILTDDGVYLLTVIDLYQDGQLLRAAIRTMMQTFPEVQLLGARQVWTYPGSSVFVIYGSSRKLDMEELKQVLRKQGAVDVLTVAQPDDQLRAYIEEGPQIVLTDQYAPVDNLISILFKSRN